MMISSNLVKSKKYSLNHFKILINNPTYHRYEKFSSSKAKLFKKPNIQHKSKTKLLDDSSDLNVSILDAAKNPENNLSFSKRSKLFSSLDTQDTKEINDRAVGTLLGIGEDIADFLNECLGSSKFIGTFKNVSDPSRFVEIVKVKINRDLSHADAYWSCPLIHDFADKIPSEIGDEKRTRVIKTMTTYINKRLSDRESQFRTEMIKKMSFKRIPRIFFHENPNKLDFYKLIKRDKSFNNIIEENHEEEELDKIK